MLSIRIQLRSQKPSQVIGIEYRMISTEYQKRSWRVIWEAQNNLAVNWLMWSQWTIIDNQVRVIDNHLKVTDSHVRVTDSCLTITCSWCGSWTRHMGIAKFQWLELAGAWDYLLLSILVLAFDTAWSHWNLQMPISPQTGKRSSLSTCQRPPLPTACHVGSRAVFFPSRLWPWRQAWDLLSGSEVLVRRVPEALGQGCCCASKAGRWEDTRFMPRGRPLAHKLALVYIRCIRSHTPSRQNRAPRNPASLTEWLFRTKSQPYWTVVNWPQHGRFPTRNIWFRILGIREALIARHEQNLLSPIFAFVVQNDRIRM